MNSPEVQQAIKEVIEELKAMPKEEFLKAIKESEGPITEFYDTMFLNRQILRCSFCGKHRDELEMLIAGPMVEICSECVDMAKEILEEKRAEPFFDLRYAP